MIKRVGIWTIDIKAIEAISDIVTELYNEFSSIFSFEVVLRSGKTLEFTGIGQKFDPEWEKVIKNRMIVMDAWMKVNKNE